MIPQMNPMFWLILMVYFTSGMSLTMIKLYYV